MIIYCITNKINGKVYIGQTIRTLKERWLAHCGTADRGGDKRIQLAIRKYGRDAFSTEILCKGVSRPQLNKLEKYFIKKYKSNDSKIGYNATIGGQSGPPPKRINKIKKERPPISEETRLKMRNAKLGIKFKPRSSEHCLKLSISNKGRIRTEEQNLNSSKAHKGTFTPKMRTALNKRLKEGTNGRQNSKKNKKICV